MTASQTLLEQALAQHRAGELERAADLYRDVIAIDPDHADALHLLGVAMHQRNDYAAAIHSIGRALEIHPEAALFHCNLGAAQRALNLLESAEASFREAVRLDPSFAGAHYNLGCVLEARGKTADAIAAYRRTLECDDGLADAYNNLGRALAKAGQLDESLDCYRHLTALRPACGTAHYNLGNALFRARRFGEAAAEFRKSLSFNPNLPEAHNNLGTALKSLERFEEAGECFSRAIALKADYAEAHNNLGTVHQFRGDASEAAACYARALLLHPDFAGAQTNLANIHHDEGFVDAAIAGYDRALTIDPNCAEAGFNRALACLRKGDFARGWAEYEWRWKRKVAPRSFPHPTWNGGPLEGRTLWVYAEQGVGDEIMFASCLPDVLSQGARVVFECDPRLVGLFSRSFPEVQVVPRLPNLDRPIGAVRNQIDLQCALGSIPRWLRPSLVSFLQRPPFLAADAAARARWRERLTQLGLRLAVGISWQGGLEIDVRRKRSTVLGQWHRLLAAPGVAFVNLQHGNVSPELEELSRDAGLTVHDWPEEDLRNDLDGLAARIAALDLVISVDNSTVHMAGALGVPVWTLLPRAADWRWLMDREDSPWYPTMRLFRQTIAGDWDHVFQRVAEALTAMVRVRVAGPDGHSPSSAADKDSVNMETANVPRWPFDHGTQAGAGAA